MTIELVKFGFTSGELSPRLFGRSDLEAYDLGLARGENWMVDYRGGLSTRPGQEFVDYVWKDDLETKFVPFRFSPDIANNYVVLFGDGYVRFLQDGGYILEDVKVITAITNGSPGIMTASNNFAVGDWVKVISSPGMPGLQNDIVQVLARTGSTVTMGTIDGQPYDTTALGTFTGPGSVARIYTVVSPYTADDFALLQAHQVRDTVRLTHPAHPVRNLKRNDVTDWVITDESFGTTVGRPGGVQVTPANSGSFCIGYVVTAVSKDGEESLPSDMKLVNTADTTNPSFPDSTVKVTWNAVSKARYYKVYRTVQSKGVNSIARGSAIGYVGRADGPFYIDGGDVVVDYTKTPPVREDPFADGAIDFVAVATQGSGYAVDCGLSVSDPTGSGFVGYPIVEVGFSGSGVGPIVAVQIINHGHNYTNPSFTVTSPGGGSGATFTATLGETGGNNPRTSAVFQQRQVYGGTENDPLTVWGSKPGLFKNFDTSQIQIADDSYELELDAEDVSPIKHMIPTRGGLLLMTQTGIWQLTGTGNNTAVTAINPTAETQVYKGVADLVPARIDTDIVYLEGKGTVVRMLTYNDVRKIYEPSDLSVLSNHLMSPQRSLTAWSYADEPFHTLWCRRQDGHGIVLTIMKEHKVMAWMPFSTQGMYEDVVVIEENNVDRVYFMVTRVLNGVKRKFIERQAPRMITQMDEAVCVDAGLVLPPNFPNRRLQVEAASGEDVLATATAATFDGRLGHVIRGGGGKMVITEVLSSTQVKVKIVNEIEDVIPFTSTPKEMARDTWTVDAPVTTIYGFNHLKGQQIQVLADGNFIPGLTVSNVGSITLPAAATRVAGGLGFRCVAKTLPIGLASSSEAIDMRRKRIVGVALRVMDSRGLLVGAQENKIYPVKDRTFELWGEPTEFMKGVKYASVEPVWEEDAALYFVQEDPLPVSIIGYVTDTDVGDEDRD